MSEVLNDKPFDINVGEDLWAWVAAVMSVNRKVGMKIGEIRYNGQVLYTPDGEPSITITKEYGNNLLNIRYTVRDASGRVQGPVNDTIFVHLIPVRYSNRLIGVPDDSETDSVHGGDVDMDASNSSSEADAGSD